MSQLRESREHRSGLSFVQLGQTQRRLVMYTWK